MKKRKWNFTKRLFAARAPNSLSLSFMWTSFFFSVLFFSFFFFCHFFVLFFIFFFLLSFSLFISFRSFFLFLSPPVFSFFFVHRLLLCLYAAKFAGISTGRLARRPPIPQKFRALWSKDTLCERPFYYILRISKRLRYPPFLHYSLSFQRNWSSTVIQRKKHALFQL